MSTWAKALIAAVAGGVLGISGGVIQLSLLESFHMVGDNVTPKYFLSEEMGIWLGAVTAAALVFWLARQYKVVGWLFLIGSVFCLLWLSLDGDSQLHRLFVSSYEPESISFPALVLLFNGVPLLWSGVLLWCALKLLYRELGGLRKGRQLQPNAKGI